MSFKVNLSARAERDLDHILEYLLARSPQGAATWLSRWDEVLVQLQESADQTTLAPENDDHKDEIHHVVFKTRRGRKYRAIFIIENESVQITHVRGPGQKRVSPDEFPQNG